MKILEIKIHQPIKSGLFEFYLIYDPFFFLLNKGSSGSQHGHATMAARYSPFAYGCLCLSTAITAISAARNEQPG
jgi:hypothetical protein